MKTYIKWILTGLFVVITGIALNSFILRILVRYGLYMLVFLAIALLNYYFFYDAILQKCKVCRKLKSLIGACIISSVCILGYVLTHPTTVQMKENVLYVHPVDKFQKTNDEIFDGSKNDPNLKPDTTDSKIQIIK